MSVRAVIMAAGLLALPAAAQAEQLMPYPDFQAKRVKPPKPGSGPRINIQIDPAEAAAAARPQDAPAQAGGEGQGGGQYGWFWEKVPGGLDGAGPGRLEGALMALSAGGASSPRLQLMQEIIRDRGIDILTSTLGTEVSPALALAVIAVESAGAPDAVSSAGAQGLMQLMPDTAARFGVADALAPKENIKGGVAYLNWLMGEFGGDPLLVLAGYNAGEGAVRTHGGVPPYAETRAYVPKVLAAYQVASGLCMTPPLLLSDGCVFQGMR